MEEWRDGKYGRDGIYSRYTSDRMIEGIFWIEVDREMHNMAENANVVEFQRDWNNRNDIYSKYINITTAVLPNLKTDPKKEKTDLKQKKWK